jgi:hypothetical protein
VSNNKLIVILLILIGILFYFKDSPFLRFVLIPLLKQNEAGYDYKDKQIDLDNMNSYLEQTLTYIEKEGFSLTSKEKNQIRYCFVNNEELNARMSKKIKDYMKNSLPVLKKPYFLEDINKFFMQKIDRPNPPKIFYRRYYKQKYDTLVELLLTVTSFEQILNLNSFYIEGMASSEIRYRLVDLNIPRDLEEAKRIKSVLFELPKNFRAVSIFGEEKVSQALAGQYALTIFLQNHKNNKELEEYQKGILNKIPEHFLNFPKPGEHALKSFLPAMFLARNVKNNTFREIIKGKSNNVYLLELEKAIHNEAIIDKVNKVLSTQLDSRQNSLMYDLELIEIFKKIDVIFSNYPSQPLKPLENSQIVSIQESILPYKLPKDLIAFYKWHNGLQIDYVTVFEPMQSVLYSYYLKIDMKNEIIWEDEYLPLHSFGSSGDEFIKLVDVEESAIYDYDYSEHSPIKYESIKEMLKLFLEALETKIIYYNDDSGKWEGNDIELEKLMSRK